jgi:two-component system NarL family sensor kinase
MGGNSNDIYIMIITVTVILLILLIFIVSFLFIYRNKQVRHQVEMKSVEEKFNQEILQTQLEIREQTLKNISEEIHDNVGQVLSLAVLNLSAIELDNTRRAADKIEDVTRLVEKAVADLRNLSKTMDSDNIARLGLVAIIKFELDLLERTGLYHTVLELSGDERRLDGEKEIILYRIVQESLNNVIKHANATQIQITLQFADDQLKIDIADNGKGFDAGHVDETTIYKSGAGIKNMQKRAKLIGGVCSIKGISSGGTTVSMTIPYSLQQQTSI